MLIGGLIVLIIGILIASVSSSAQSYTSRQSEQCDSLGGQLGQFLSNDAREDCQNAVMYQTASSGAIMLGWGIALLGVVLAGVGGIQIARHSGHARATPDNTRERMTIPAGKIFCRYCGKLLPVAGTLCSECAKPTASTTTEVKKCNYCSATMSNDSDFCANCGRKF